MSTDSRISSANSEIQKDWSFQWSSEDAWTESGRLPASKSATKPADSALLFWTARNSEFQEKDRDMTIKSFSFLDNIVRLTEDNYVPTIQDIVHCRISTTGINEIAFNHKKMDFKLDCKLENKRSHSFQNGGCWRSTQRAPKMDSLLRQCGHDPFYSLHEWLRSTGPWGSQICNWNQP